MRFLMIIASLMASAQASEIQLRAADGTFIRVGYTKTSTSVQDLGIWVNSPAINAFAVNTSVVIVGHCNENEYDYTFSITCSPDASGWTHLSSACVVGSSSKYTYVRNIAWSMAGNSHLILVNDPTVASNQSCRYELAISRNRTWLVDPINRSHNFELHF